MTRSGPVLAAACAALCLFAPRPAAAQAEQEYDENAVRAQMAVVLSERDRVRGGYDEPPQTVGLEQGDNEIRSQTPALENSARSQGRHDSDDLHRRALAMYESRAHFSSAGAAEFGGVSDDGPVKAKRAPTAPVAAPSTERERSGLRWLCAALIAVGAAIAWFGWKRSNA